MSSPIYMEKRTLLSLRERWCARIGTSVAFWLVKLKPGMLVRVLKSIAVTHGEADYSEVERIRTSINSVSARCAGNGCLQRSVAAMIIARMKGIPLAWRSGFRINPFIAHAWVEVDGRPVGETMDLTSFHISLAVGANDD